MKVTFFLLLVATVAFLAVFQPTVEAAPQDVATAVEAGAPGTAGSGSNGKSEGAATGAAASSEGDKKGHGKGGKGGKVCDKGAKGKGHDNKGKGQATGKN